MLIDCADCKAGTNVERRACHACGGMGRLWEPRLRRRAPTDVGGLQPPYVREAVAHARRAAAVSGGNWFTGTTVTVANTLNVDGSYFHAVLPSRPIIAGQPVYWGTDNQVIVGPPSGGDDTPAIQAALDAVAEEGNGG